MGESTFTIQSMPRIVHPDWYRTPLPEDDPRMIGDYPDVPIQPYQLRNPYGDYFDVQNRRQWGELVHEDVEPLLMWSWDTEATYGWGWLVAAWTSLFGGFGLFYWLLKDVPSPFAYQLEPKKLLPSVASYFPGGNIPKYIERTG